MVERQLAGRRVDRHPADRIDLDGHPRLLVWVLPWSIGLAYHRRVDAADPDPIRAALIAERARLLEEIGEAIVAPGQMTYGSQAAAASQVFAQQRDLALRDRADHQLALVDEASRGSTPARSGRASDAASRSHPSGSRRSRGQRAASIASASAPASAEASMTDARPRRLVTLDDIRAAAERLRGITIRTPLVPFGPPDARRWLKAESLQPIGAFKLRGAYVAVASLSAEALARGVITYSSGNHAQGVARAARLLGRPGGRRHAIRCAGDEARTCRRRRRRDRRRRNGER